MEPDESGGSRQEELWLRIVGDSVFLSGVGALAWFVIGLKTGWSYVKQPAAAAAPVGSFAQRA